jgi:hypothetical protein
MVRRLINGREGCFPSDFSSKGAAIEFINILRKMEDDTLDCEYHLYEVTEIDIPKGEPK